MGDRTYRQVSGFGEYPYPDKKAFVFTRDATRERDEHVDFATGDIVGFTAGQKRQPGRPIWLVGGAEVIGVLLDAGVVDELLIFVLPVVLGDGRSLLVPGTRETLLELSAARSYPSGVVELGCRVTGVGSGG